jgi:DNA-binding NarL/FixJ family response regulator
MKPTICFIDDSAFEHELVRNEIGSKAPDFEFAIGYTFEETTAKLSARAPVLFLLDLWGKDESVVTPRIASKEDLEMQVAKIPTVNQIYDGLDEFGGDVANEYLKRLFAIVDGWRSMFEGICAQVGQSRQYGLTNLQKARNHYPDVPAVFYTRKSLISDAVAVFKAGADGLFIKPTGANDRETRRLTSAYAPQLIKELKQIIAFKAKQF